MEKGADLGVEKAVRQVMEEGKVAQRGATTSDLGSKRKVWGH